MSKLLKNSGWSLLAQGGKVITQAGLFVLLARGFGVHDFGLYMAIFSISQLLYPFSGLGTHNTMVMRVSRCPRLLPVYFWTPLVSTIFMGLGAAAVLSPFISSMYTTSIVAVALILLTELVAYRLLDLATHAWQSMENLRSGAFAYLSISVGRLLLAACLFLSDHLTLVIWAVGNFGLTLLVAIYNLQKMTRKYAIKCQYFVFYPREIRRGIYFSLSGGSQAVNANIDKIVLSRLGGLSDLGVYSAAYRVIQMGLLPMMAIFQATYPRYFKAGRAGLKPALAVSRSVAMPLLVYGIVASAGIALLAPFAPWVLGGEYKPAIFLIQLLAPLPLLQIGHYLLGEAMTGAGLQRQRALIQIGAGGASLFLNILLISLFGVVGAVVAALVCEVLLIVGYSIIVKNRLVRHQCF
ncbi:oligosaccharide flippase family protein [Salinicola sp. CR57]|uniref:lipopolysaccharide biosynthesis protein n=1 Tax=Salinicola sp. CR57 TaxID=1949086 RepID=UPI000DA1EB7B|nr:oligosaccharide flippase family protein [Salinicola sp. CR57]